LLLLLFLCFSLKLSYPIGYCFVLFSVLLFEFTGQCMIESTIFSKLTSREFLLGGWRNKDPGMLALSVYFFIISQCLFSSCTNERLAYNFNND
jgi:hypothetical protein